MNKYEPTNIQQIIDGPSLSENCFQQIFKEFIVFEKNNIINSINNNGSKINNAYPNDNNNNFQKDEIFINFGKKINNQELSPIPISSFDSQKNKFSSNSDKCKENLYSPMPINNDILPIIKDLNEKEPNKNNENNILHFPIKNDLNEMEQIKGIKKIEFIQKNSNNELENKWKILSKSLIFNQLVNENNINNSNSIKLPSIIIPKLLIYNKKNELINDNQNNNNINMSREIKDSLEKQSKIVSNAVLKKVSEDSIDDNNVDNSNYYYLEKEKEEEEKFHEYIQTNIEKILSINFDKIFYNNQSNSMIEQVKKLYKNVYEKENENIANIDKINLNTKNNELIYTIKEDLDEDKEEPESKNISMKNNSLKNTSYLNKNKESLNNINDKEIKEENEIFMSFDKNKIDLNNKPNSKELEKLNNNKRSNTDDQDYSEFFEHEPNNLDIIELKLNNKYKESLNNLDDDKNGLASKNIIKKENMKDNTNYDEKNDKKTSFSFSKKDFNNIIYSDNNDNLNTPPNGKNSLNSNHKEIDSNELFTFDKTKSEQNSKINNNKNISINLEKEKLINNNDYNNIYNSSKMDNIDLEKNKTDKNKNSNENRTENIYNVSSYKKEEKGEIVNINDNNIYNSKENNFNNNCREIDNNYNNNILIEENQIYDNNNKEDEMYTNEKEYDYKNNDTNNNKNKIENNHKRTEAKEHFNPYKKDKLKNNKELINTNNENEKEIEINNINNDEQIIINMSDSVDKNNFNRFNNCINSPEICSSMRTPNMNYNTNINIKSNLFNPKIITRNQLENLAKLYPNSNIQINEENINKDFLKYFLHDYNCIVFTNNWKDINKNIYKLTSLQHYFNILKKMNEKTIFKTDPFIEILINFISKKIEKIKLEQNISSNLILKENDNKIFEEENSEPIARLFSALNSKLREIKNFHEDSKAKKNNKNILKLREELKEIYEDYIEYIEYINNKSKKSIFKKIYYYQKIIDHLKMEMKISDKIINKNKLKDTRELKIKDQIISFLNPNLTKGAFLSLTLIVLLYAIYSHSF